MIFSPVLRVTYRSNCVPTGAASAGGVGLTIMLHFGYILYFIYTLYFCMLLTIILKQACVDSMHMNSLSIGTGGCLYPGSIAPLRLFADCPHYQEDHEI